MAEPVGVEDPEVYPVAVSKVPLIRRYRVNKARTQLGSVWPPNAIVLARNARALRRHRPWEAYLARRGELEGGLDERARRALGWIRTSQDQVGSGGVGDYQFGGWTPGYPEVTGYIIPTLWDYHRALGDDDLAQRAIRMADWELGLQKPKGGFESLYEGDNQPPVVFNTGQVIRGLVRTYQETEEERYLDAATRAGDWIVAMQEPDGSWAKANYRGMKRTYDAFVSAAVAGLFLATSDEVYANAARRQCEFVLRNQRANGWFDLCDNTPEGNATPSTHTLCYTADGLLETGEKLKESAFVEACERATAAMTDRVEPGGRLPGRFDSDWRPACDYVVVTGSAQLGVVLDKLYMRSGDERQLRTALELLDFLAFVQDLSAAGRNRSGGLPGSYPIWGGYVPMKYPSWPAKFFLDHLRLVRLASEDESSHPESASHPEPELTAVGNPASSAVWAADEPGKPSEANHRSRRWGEMYIGIGTLLIIILLIILLA